MTPKQVPVSTILYEKMHLGSGGSGEIKVSRKSAFKKRVGREGGDREGEKERKGGRGEIYSKNYEELL